MKLYLANKWDELSTSFWFVPSTMVLVAIGLSLATLQFDTFGTSQKWLATLGWTFLRGPEGSRAVLSAVAGSMMTIASVTFSITIVALQLASSQFGPRLLRNFMRDLGNQISIGTFIATFTYCLLILRTINGTEQGEFVPHLSVTVGLVLSLVSLGVFIYFIHHSAESIQAENVIAGVSRELHRAIDRLYPDDLGRDQPGTAAQPPKLDLPENFERDSMPVAATVSDYLQAIDVDRLLALAEEHDLILAVKQRPGKFFFEGGSLMLAWPASRVDDSMIAALRGTFYFGTRRTLTQDVEFAIDQLVEVAVRALSPGVNDPFTAINCVERLGAALCKFSDKSIPSSFRYDEQGRLRVVTDASTIRGIVDDTLDQIRQAARSDAAVTIRLLETIEAVGHHTKNPEFRTALRRQADAIFRGSQEGLADSQDRKDAKQRHREAIRALDGGADALKSTPVKP